MAGFGLAALAATPAPAQGVTVEGDAAALTLVADQANRSAILAALADRLGLKTSGNTIRDEPVSGRFSGDLPHVLQAVLDDNGFVIAYAEGQPVRIVLTGQASAAQPNWSSDPMEQRLPPAPPPAGKAGLPLQQVNPDFFDPMSVPTPPAAAPKPAPPIAAQNDPNFDPMSVPTLSPPAAGQPMGPDPLAPL